MVTVDGNNITLPGQASIGTPPSSSSHAVRHDDKRLMYRVACSLNDFNVMPGSAPVDGTPIPVPSGVTKFAIAEAWFANPTDDYSAATIGFYTAAAGGGIELLTPTALTDLGVLYDTKRIVTSNPKVGASASIYPRLTAQSTNAGNVDIILFLIDLSNIVSTTA